MDPFARLVEMADRLDRIQVPWVLGGSLASSIIGEPRSTADIDVAVRIGALDITRFMSVAEDDYYIDAEMIRDAVDRSSSFNLIHFQTGFKVDFFVLGDSVLDRRALIHRQALVVPEAGGRTIWVGSPEDQILRKLWWYRLGGEASDRQLRDVAAIIEAQRDVIDSDELRRIAEQIDIGDLVDRMLGG